MTQKPPKPAVPKSDALKNDTPASWPPNIQAVLKKPSPASQILGLEICAVRRAQGEVEVAFAAGDKLCNKWGGIQGGMVAAMLDDVMALAIGLNLDWGQISPTLELKISMLAPVRPGRITGRGWVVRQGRSIGFVAGELRNADGQILATGTSTTSVATIKKRAQSAAKS